MPFYAKATECHYFKPDSKALDPYPLPLDEIGFERTGNLLRITYRHKLYTLGIAENGTLQGFRGSITHNATSDLAILKTGPFSFGIFERRFTNEEQLEAEAAALELAGKDLSNGAYSCGYRDYQRNLDGYSASPNPACPSGMPPAPLRSGYPF